ncbi:MAG: hypothetical protein U9R00_01680 [Patescibacteria group bacterium]|nr:hypothetical protein [Patescibacteria group bacterium]
MKVINESDFPIEYTKKIFVHKDNSVRDAEYNFLGKYIGAEYDNFASTPNKETFWPSIDEITFTIANMFIKKEKKYYEVSLMGKLRRVSLLEINLCRLNSLDKKKTTVKKLKRIFRKIVPYREHQLTLVK